MPSQRVRRQRLALITAGVVLFFAIVVVLTRWLSAEGLERADITDLLKAQARGDAPAMQHQLHDCDAACVRETQALATRLKGSGQLQIIRVDSATSHVLSSKTGPSRVVWRTAGRLPTVQCVRVRRKGSLLAGMSVSLLSLSAPIGRQSAC